MGKISVMEVLTSVAISFILYQYLNFHRLRNKVKNIPTVGSTWSDTFLGAYIATWKYLFQVEDWTKEGYRKYYGTAFKMPTFLTPSGWIIVATGETMLEEMRKAPADVLSFHDATMDSLETEGLFGRHATESQFHIPTIRTPLTKSIGEKYPEIQDEIVAACTDYLPKGDDWEPVPKIHEQLMHIVCRTSNRLFVGLPVCRDPEYMKIQEEWTVHVIVGGYILHLTPWFLKPLVSPLLNKVNSSAKRVEAFVGPLITERLQREQEYGKDYEGKPNDMISWLVDYAPPKHKNVEDITVRLMLSNFGAIHTSSLATSHVLLNLAARQEYIKPLRAEIEECTRAAGWTKEAMARMYKLDSFLKESLRLSGFSSVISNRKALKDFTFSNGVTIPAGFTVAVALTGIHHNPDFYEEPDTFNGYRFLNKASEDPLLAQTVSLDPMWFIFGHGRNACPGRFFAVNEVKTIISHILLNYDIKLPGDATKVMPGPRFAGSQGVSPDAQVVFRKRRVE